MSAAGEALAGRCAGLPATARSYGVHVSSRAAELLSRFLELLYEWNASAGLTTVPEDRAPNVHLLDSLLAADLVPAAARVADLGTGGGLPGLPLAIVRVDLRISLVENSRRKTSYLRHVLRELDLPHVEVCHGDARELGGAAADFDLVITRGLRSGAALLELAMPCLRAGGRLLAMGGPHSAPQLATAVATSATMRLEAQRRLWLPEGEERVLQLIQMVGS